MADTDFLGGDDADFLGGNDTDVSITFTDEETDQNSLLKGDTSSGADANASFYSLAYYRVYFDVTTSQVLKRMFRSLLPKATFHEEGGPKPDLYGPFWISTTLVFLMAVTGNFANYLNFLPTDKNVVWKYDFEKVTLAATMFYSMTSIIPIAVWLALRRVGVSLFVTELISLYGYSFAIYVPASIVCVAPIELVRWITVGVCFCSSSLFLVRNVWGQCKSTVEENPEIKMKVYGLVGTIFLMHLCVAFVTKFYFFHWN